MSHFPRSTIPRSRHLTFEQIGVHAALTDYVVYRGDEYVKRALVRYLTTLRGVPSGYSLYLVECLSRRVHDDAEMLAHDIAA